MKRTYNCEICNLDFKTFQGKANHVRWNHKDKEFYEKTIKKLSEATTKRNEITFGKWVDEKVKCHKCENMVDVRYREDKKKDKYFCSVSCANTRSHSDETKKKISESISKRWEEGVFDETTAKNHLKQSRLFSSKNERMILKHFKGKYQNDNWTSGGGLKCEGKRISRDMYSNKLKVCFEYDGVWHFKDINGQLEKKQLKDKLLEKWCVENGYRLIRVDEISFNGVEQIEDLIYKCNDNITKVGERY
jgi:hypothetical protein